MRRLAVALALLLCAGARAEEVMVYAAASLAEPLAEIGAAYRVKTGVTPRFSFGASSDLARQIIAGAPADVFFSADVAQMRRVEQAGLVTPGSGIDLLSNVLVVVVPSGAPATLARPADLASVGRLALADPEAVPAGAYARQWLESIGLWRQLAPRVVPLLDVRAALAAAESGNAGAAIVYATDAALSKRVRVAFAVPREEGPKIVYVVAPLSRAKAAAGRAFTERLRSPESARVFEKHGFLVLGSK